MYFTPFLLWGQFDPSSLKLKTMIIFQIVTNMYVSGALGILVDYLNNHLNKTLTQPSTDPFIHPEFLLCDYRKIYESP